MSPQEPDMRDFPPTPFLSIRNVPLWMGLVLIAVVVALIVVVG